MRSSSAVRGDIRV